MTPDPRLERYLASLERTLKPFSVSDRAEIITEIKSHVLSALERDPQARLDSILNALGEPETVANRYLLERGLKPGKTSISPIVKWLIIGFLCTVAMILVFTGFVLHHYDSLVQVDGPNEKVEILNGFVRVDGKKGKISISGLNEASSGLTGLKTMPSSRAATIKFNSGKFEIRASESDKLTWACTTKEAFIPKPEDEGNTFNLDFSNLSFVNCKVSIPEGSPLLIRGGNGKIVVTSPAFDLDAQLENGKIVFQNQKKSAYKFDVLVQNGKTDTFTSSEQKKSHLVKMHVANGIITNNETEDN